MIKQKHIQFGIRLILAFALLVFIGYKIIGQPFWGDIGNIELSNLSLVYLVLVFLLMPINWGIEAWKWKIVMQSLREFSIMQALRSVLAGITTGIITPNRIGNFIGRTYQLEKGIKTKATFLTFLTNLAQYITTISFGLVGLFFFGIEKFHVDPVLVGSISLALLFLGFYVYFKPSFMYIKALHKWYPNRILEGIEHVQSAPVDQKLKVLLLSQVRYSVFILQYALLLLVFTKNHSLTDFVFPVMLVYFIMTITPSLFFGKLIVREASALLVLSMLNISTPIILISGFVLWCVNLALPSLIGAGFLFAKK